MCVCVCVCVCVWALLVGVDFEEAGMAAALAAKTAVWTPSSSFSSACLSEASKAGSMVAGSGSFVTGACLQLGSRTSSLRGTGVASTNSMRCQRSSRSIGVVSPRAVSDSQSPGDTCLDPDASRVRTYFDALVVRKRDNHIRLIHQSGWRNLRIVWLIACWFIPSSPYCYLEGHKRWQGHDMVVRTYIYICDWFVF